MTDLAEINAIAASPAFGARYSGPLPAQKAQRITVLNNNLIEGYPGPVSVHLFRNDRGESSLEGLNADCWARITYANGAVSNTIYCDWNGQFSIVCNKITIEMESYRPDGILSVYAPGTANWVFGALLGLGSCPSVGDAIGYTAEREEVWTWPVMWTRFRVPDLARRWYPNVAANSGIVLNDADLGSLLVLLGDIRGDYSLLSTAGNKPCFPLTRAMIHQGIALPGGVSRVAIANPQNVPCNLTNYFALGL